MPMKSDGKRRWVDVSTLVPGTPEDVWRMIATGEGMTAWFTPTTIEERVGGALVFSLGPGVESKGIVTAYEQPTRFAYEEHDWNGAAPPIATEVTVESRSGDRCVVRMVHSMATTSTDWDDELDGFEKGWASYFLVLQSYLQHFRGAPGASAQGWGYATGTPAEIWKQVASDMGLVGACAGDRVTVLGRTGEIEHALQRSDVLGVQVRFPDGIASVAAHTMGDKTRVGALLFEYGEEAPARAEAHARAWEAWATERFSR